MPGMSLDYKGLKGIAIFYYFQSKFEVNLTIRIQDIDIFYNVQTSV